MIVLLSCFVAVLWHFLFELVFVASFWRQWTPAAVSFLGLVLDRLVGSRIVVFGQFTCPSGWGPQFGQRRCDGGIVPVCFGFEVWILSCGLWWHLVLRMVWGGAECGCVCFRVGLVGCCQENGEFNCTCILRLVPPYPIGCLVGAVCKGCPRSVEYYAVQSFSDLILLRVVFDGCGLIFSIVFQ